MNYFVTLVAHAGEDHRATTESLSHYVAPWYIAIPSFLLVIGAIGYLTWLLSGKKLDKTLIVVAIVMLVSGFMMFVISPAVSIISFTGGILLSGLLSFTSLSGKNEKIANRP
jgi:predicted membrane protein